MDGRRKFELNLLDQVPLAMLILALDGTIGYWNKGAEALYGWPRRDVMRRPFEALAARVGVTRRSIQGYEAGAIAPYRHLDQLAEALGRSREWLVAERPADDLPNGMPAELKTELRHLIREELAASARPG